MSSELVAGRALAGPGGSLSCSLLPRIPEKRHILELGPPAPPLSLLGSFLITRGLHCSDSVGQSEAQETLS